MYVGETGTVEITENAPFACYIQGATGRRSVTQPILPSIVSAADKSRDASTQMDADKDGR
jgi:hypothetical protein